MLFPRNKKMTRKKKRYFIVKSLRLANALCHLHVFFCFALCLVWQEPALLSFPIPLPLLLQSNTATAVKRDAQGVQVYGAFILVHLDRGGKAN